MKYLGTLFGWWETGTEGAIWALDEDGKTGYEAMQVIDEGDQLKIYDENGKVLFDGIIEPDKQIGWTEYPLNPGHGQPLALGFWIHWTQKGWQPDDWAALFLREEFGKTPLRGELVKK